MTDPGPVPDGVLPDGWTPTDDAFAFEHQVTGLTVCADRRPEDAAETGTAGAPCGWQVRYERPVGEATDRRTVGTVTTRDAAVSALLSCMRRVSHDRGRTEPDAAVDGRWTALSTLAEGVTLRDSVPGAEGEGGVDTASYARSWAARLDGE